MCKLSDLSAKLVVMSRKASDFLKDIYAVPEEKIALIHHGIPDTPFIVPFPNPDAMAELTIGLLDNDVDRHAMPKKAYIFSRDAIWKEVSRKYLQVFREVQLNRTRNPHPGIPMLKTSRPSPISSSRRSSLLT